MFKIISSNEYEEMTKIIEKQNDQIDELINMVIEARRLTSHTTKCYCDLVELIDKNLQSLPSEAIDTINEIRKLMKNKD